MYWLGVRSLISIPLSTSALLLAGNKFTQRMLILARWVYIWSNAYLDATTEWRAGQVGMYRRRRGRSRRNWRLMSLGRIWLCCNRQCIYSGKVTRKLPIFRHIKHNLGGCVLKIEYFSMTLTAREVSLVGSVQAGAYLRLQNLYCGISGRGGIQINSLGCIRNTAVGLYLISNNGGAEPVCAV